MHGWPRPANAYGAARRVLIDRADDADDGARTWVSPPEQTDESVMDHTGRSWNEWCDIIDAWPEADQGHAAVAARLLDEFDVTGWWGQGITVGWERITGRRLVNQMSDGTFTAAVSRTIGIDAARLRRMLYDDADRWKLFWTDWLDALNDDAANHAEDDVRRREGTGSADVGRLRT